MASAIAPVRQDAVDAKDSLATSIRSELTSQYLSLCPSPVVERALARITSAAVAAVAVGETVVSFLKTRVEIRKVMYDFALEISAAKTPADRADQLAKVVGLSTPVVDQKIAQISTLTRADIVDQGIELIQLYRAQQIFRLTKARDAVRAELTPKQSSQELRAFAKRSLEL